MSEAEAECCAAGGRRWEREDESGKGAGTDMRRIMLRVAYDGTDYCGWQSQPNGTAVEEVINRELSALLKEPVLVIGASRTDSGVHALGNVCVFDTESQIPGEKFSYALNSRLPKDIVIQHSCEVEGNFHPRRCTCRKTYEYRIYNSVFPNPLLSRYSHFLYRELDAEAMRRAAGYLVGEHDFKSFCSVNTQVKDTVRTIHSIEISEQAAGEMSLCCAAPDLPPEPGRNDATGWKSAEPVLPPEPGRNDGTRSSAMPVSGQPGAGRLITIRVSGGGFLYNMVRIISGTLIEAGLHWREPETMPQILAACDRAAAGPTAPACGLTLVEICYPEQKKMV